MNENALLSKNQKTGLIVIGFSFIFVLLVFLTNPGVLLFSFCLFCFGVYLFFKQDKPIDTTPPENKEIKKLLLDRDTILKRQMEMCPMCRQMWWESWFDDEDYWMDRESQEDNDPFLPGSTAYYTWGEGSEDDDWWD